MAGEITQLRAQVANDRLARTAADAFERHYQSYLAGSYATFELFQVGAGRAPARPSFTEFYSVPSVARRSLSPTDTALTGTGTDVGRCSPSRGTSCSPPVHLAVVLWGMSLMTRPKRQEAR